MRSGFALFLITATLLGDDLPSEVLLLSRIKTRVAEGLAHTKAYTCLEEISRFEVSPVGRSKLLDTVHVEVAFLGDRELFSWPGGTRFDDSSHNALLGSGLLSTGEFTGHARAIFQNAGAVIRYHGEEPMPGHAAVRYDYTISPFSNRYEIKIGGRSAVVGTRGSFWADRDTCALLRILAIPDPIPTELNLRDIQADVNYSVMRFGADRYLLPQSARVTKVPTFGPSKRNEIEFTRCRPYHVSSSLSFEPVTAGTSPPVSMKQEFTVPPRLIVPLVLETEISSRGNVVGDPITAVVEWDVLTGRKVVITKGATLSGRITRLEHKEPFSLVGLEFTDLDDHGRQASFFALLENGGPTHSSHISTVGMIQQRAQELNLPKGFRMRWRTISFKR